MIKDFYRKILVFGIILVLITISNITNGISNSISSENIINPITEKDTLLSSYNENYNDNTINDSSESIINPIFLEDTKSNNNENCYYILWTGDAVVEFTEPGGVIININCDPTGEDNISITCTDLIIVFLYKTTIKCNFIPVGFKYAYYYLTAEIDDDIRGDSSRLRIDEVGTKSNILGMGYLLQNACNKSVKITYTLKVFALFPFQQKDCVNTLILNITCS